MSVVSHSLRSASLHGFIDLAQSMGLNPSQLLREVGIDRSSLDDGDTPISVRSACELLERAAHISGVETFGLQMAAQRRLSNLGLIGIVLREEPTGLAMLESLCRYLTLANHTLSLQLEQQQDFLIIREDVLVSPYQQKTQSIELGVGVLARILFEIMGKQWQPYRVCFQHNKPINQTRHKQFFKAPLKFNAPFNGIVCRKIDFERLLPNTDSNSVSLVRKSLDLALAKQQQGLAKQVQALIGILLPTGRCQLRNVAQHFGVTPRTIHRQLGQENTQFNELLSQTRQQIAVVHLSHALCDMAELSERLGFSSPSVFSHWFKSTFGVNTRDWRKARQKVRE